MSRGFFNLAISTRGFFILGLFFFFNFYFESAAFQTSQHLRECNVFYEQEEMVIIEAESVPEEGDWKLKTAHAGYTGNGYYEWTGPDHFFAGGEGILRYDFMINAPGLYQFQLRSFNPDNDHTEHNDVWLKFPGQQVLLENHETIPADEWVKVFHYITQSWTWLTITEGGYKVFVYFDQPGRYTVELSGRSSKFAIDRMALHKDQEELATWIGMEESAMRPCDPSNNPPVANGVVPYQRFPYRESFSYSFDDWIFQDPDGDDLSFSAVMWDNASLPHWLNFNGTTRTFSGASTRADVGNYRMKVRALDPDGRVAETSFTLSIFDPEVNQAPVLVIPIWANSATVNRKFEFTFLKGAFEDPDGDELTYSAFRSDGSDLSSWLSFDGPSRTFSGTPLAEDIGEHHIKVVARDPDGEIAEAHFIIYVIDKGYPVGLEDKFAGIPAKLYPNPVKDRFYIEFETEFSGKAQWMLINAAGMIITESESEIESGKIQISLNEPRISRGVYTLKIILGNKEVKNFKLVKQH